MSTLLGSGPDSLEGYYAEDPGSLLKRQGHSIFENLFHNDCSGAIGSILDSIREVQQMRGQLEAGHPAFDAYNRIKNKWTLVLFAMLQTKDPMNRLQQFLGLNKFAIEALKKTTR